MHEQNKVLKRDLALKEYISNTNGDKSKYQWHEIFNQNNGSALEAKDSLIKIIQYDLEDDYDSYQVAEKVGRALTNLYMSLSKNENEIFTEKNKAFVYKVVKKVSSTISEMKDEYLKNNQNKENLSFRLNIKDLNYLIEKTLVDLNAYDIATSFLLEQSFEKKEQEEFLKGKVRVIRRNNQIVPWNSAKIEVAIRKAFLSLEEDSSPAVEIVEAVCKFVESTKIKYIHIEEIQDLVQEKIMKAGHFKVAENYIVYRTQRNFHRDLVKKDKEDLSSKKSTSQLNLILVIKEDQSSFMWDGEDLKKRISYAMMGLDLCLNFEEIETELRRSVFNEITEKDIKKTIILNAKSLIEKDADFSLFSGRILLSYIYEEVLNWDIVKNGIGKLKQFHEKYFKKYLLKGIEIDILDKNLLSYKLEKLSKMLDPTSDMDFDYLGIQTLYDRYLLVDKTKKEHRRMETPQIFWMRVAMGIFFNEKNKKEDFVIGLYSLYKSRLFCSSTPTLFNSGTKHSQLSSCYLYWVDDSIEGIMQRGIAENAYLSKWAGGLGGSWTSVRGVGSYIKGTNGESQGVIPFLKLHNDQLVAVNQGGKRRGSGCVYLEVWHNDLMEFLELRRNTGDDRRRTHDMNTANWIPDLFMKRLELRKNWTLFRSNEVLDLHHIYGEAFEKRYVEYEKKAEKGLIYGKVMSAIEIWKKMLQMLFETGHPWITFKDACNIRNPQSHQGVIHSSNLCTEITLNTGKDETAVCNLGSIVIDNHLDEFGNIEHQKLKETINIAIRSLDNIIDINFYPTKPAKNSNQRHRPIGLGAMGLQNALYKKNISFASEEAIEFNDEFFESLSYYAYEASSELAKEKGVYSSYKDSKWSKGLLPLDTAKILEEKRQMATGIPFDKMKMDWDDLKEKIKKHGMRNSNVVAIAPTATISNIMKTTPCIEPTYKNLFVKSNLSGDFIVLNSYLVKDLKRVGLWDQEMIDNLKYFDGELEDIDTIPEKIKNKYVTSFLIDYNFIINAAARRQKWIDQSQSLNLWLKHPSIKIMSHMYRAAWKKGIKTTYYLRTLGASNIEKATIALKTQKEGEEKEVNKNACSLDDDSFEVCQ